MNLKKDINQHGIVLLEGNLHHVLLMILNILYFFTLDKLGYNYSDRDDVIVIL